MNKMKNRQFDEADLTIGELTITCDVIASSICRLYHGRPQYAPQKDDDDGSQQQQNQPAAGNDALSSIDLARDLKAEQPEQPESPKEPRQAPEPSSPAPPEAPSTKPPSADEH